MTQLKMNSDKDVAIENNRLVWTSHNSDEEISQRLVQNLKFFLGEWFLDQTEGLPYFQAVFVKGTPPDIIEAKRLMSFNEECPHLSLFPLTSPLNRLSQMETKGFRYNRQSCFVAERRYKMLVYFGFPSNTSEKTLQCKYRILLTDRRGLPTAPRGPKGICRLIINCFVLPAIQTQG